MIIRRATVSSIHSGACIPAWKAVEQIQKQPAASYRLVTQPDHAHLSGAIAAGFDRARIPLVSDDVVEAIRLHDEGWAQFEGHAMSPHELQINGDGRPLTFLDVVPEIFLKAWSGSIASAAKVSPTGHYLVSAHFRILAENRLRAVVDPPETADRLRDFIAQQAECEHQLMPTTGRNSEELESLVEVLRFCDLISLAICAGVSGSVEFPNDFGLGVIRMQGDGNRFTLDPSPLSQRCTFDFPELQFGSEPLRAGSVAITLS